MKSIPPLIQGVPVNIITGFLGVGKTTAILQLLKSKPENQRWAVLVNEFGEIGVDGSILEGKLSEEGGVHIKEVPGGCMCCAAGLPMQVALNKLLTQAKPDRLLIEPTGLGHPLEVLQVLSEPHYHGVLDIQKCLTLVDARKLNDPRYTSHATFNQQIDIADIIIGNKNDLYEPDDEASLRQYVKERCGDKTPVITVSQGQFELDLLEGKSSAVQSLEHHHSHAHHSENSEFFDPNTQAIPECGYLKRMNEGEGYASIGWRFSPDKIFNRAALFSWLCGIKVERIKGVFITNEGVFGYNRTGDTMTEIELDDCLESRMEIIGHEGDMNSYSDADPLHCLLT